MLPCLHSILHQCSLEPLPALWEQEGAIHVYNATGHARTEEAGWTIIIRPPMFTTAGEDSQTPFSFCHVLSASSDKASPFGTHYIAQIALKYVILLL